jgi:thymidylate synthase (FAD)
MQEHKNKVELVGYYGGDETHALSAWTSTSRELTPEKRERIPKLLKFLVEGSDGQSHGTPFEKSMLHFLVTADIATHIHFLKHRIAVSINTESARYKEYTEDKFYVPDDWPRSCTVALHDHILDSYRRYHATVEELIANGIDKKRAKESARFFLPYGIQLQFDVAFNFRSFMHFVKLRAKPGAQKEVREITLEMIRLVKELPEFRYSCEAWGI